MEFQSPPPKSHIIFFNKRPVRLSVLLLPAMACQCWWLLGQRTPGYMVQDIDKQLQKRKKIARKWTSWRKTPTFPRLGPTAPEENSKFVFAGVQKLKGVGTAFPEGPAQRPQSSGMSLVWLALVPS